MPEGPTIVILREEAARFAGRKILRAEGNARIDMSRLTGRKVVAFRSWGKHFLVELPEVGRAVAQNAAMAVVESVKAASDVYAPVSGKVVEVNGALSDDPALVNGDAEGAGWFCKLEITKPDELDGLRVTLSDGARKD